MIASSKSYVGGRGLRDCHDGGGVYRIGLLLFERVLTSSEGTTGP